MAFCPVALFSSFVLSRIQKEDLLFTSNKWTELCIFFSISPMHQLCQTRGVIVRGASSLAHYSHVCAYMYDWYDVHVSCAFTRGIAHTVHGVYMYVVLDTCIRV